MQSDQHQVTLTWKPRLHKLKTTLSWGCYALSKLRMYLMQDAMKTMYHSLFHSKMQYGIASWGGCSVTNQLPIFRLQKRALRLVFSQQNRTPSHPLFIKTKIPNKFKGNPQYKNQEFTIILHISY